MAKIGCKCLGFAKKTASGTEGGKILSPLVDANLTVNLATGELYGDDELQDSISEFISGALACNLTDLEPADEALMFGSTQAESAGDLTDKVSDEPPEGVVAYYRKIRRKVSGIMKTMYEGVSFQSARATLGSDNAQTKNASITFQTSPISFTIKADSTGAWRVRKTLDTEAAALAWVKEKLGITAGGGGD